jgi:hypothetical protein
MNTTFSRARRSRAAIVAPVKHAKRAAAGLVAFVAVSLSSLSPALADCPGGAAGTSTFPVSGTGGAAAPCTARHEGKRLMWDPAFNRMDAPEMVVTGASVGVALAGAILKPLNTGWTGGVLFDDAIRDHIRAASYQGRLDVRDASDVGLGLMVSFPILVDSLIVAYWYRGSSDVAVQMGLIDAETMAVAIGVQEATAFLAGRQRPYVSGCGTPTGPGNNTIDCNTLNENRSFFSGHSTMAFTSASLICAHHVALDLFDSAADAITCVSGYLAAGAIATFRVIGDMHYATDVITGALFGSAVGLAIPLLHHYKGKLENNPMGSMRVVPSLTGASLTGTF